MRKKTINEDYYLAYHTNNDEKFHYIYLYCNDLSSDFHAYILASYGFPNDFIFSDRVHGVPFEIREIIVPIFMEMEGEILPFLVLECLFSLKKFLEVFSFDPYSVTNSYPYSFLILLLICHLIYRHSIQVVAFHVIM
jgi:hypothetical protein